MAHSHLERPTSRGNFESKCVCKGMIYKECICLIIKGTVLLGSKISLQLFSHEILLLSSSLPLRMSVNNHRSTRANLQ